MKRILYLIIIYILSATAHAQHVFQSTSLSKALIELDQSSKHYDISFVYDELEDFTVTKTIKRGRSLPDAVREVCGFYPVKVSVKGRDILVECIQKDRTKLMGRLMDSDRQPVPYANITLSLPDDSIYIGGGVSNEAGDFVIPCGAERAKVRISCVGFKTIERVMPIGHVGTIRMQMENYNLGNVSVNGRMPVIRNEADRLQYLVSNDEFARGLSAQELLNRVPMVTMAGSQAMILGKGQAHFMLNGRITDLGDEAIRQKLWTMRSEDIDRIEVLSIPSGRDAMEMGGGYINIVLRRDQALGWRGDVSTEAGVSDDWSGRASGSVSYASEKFDMTLDAHGGRTTQTTDNLTTYDIGNDAKIISDTRTRQKDKELAANLTLRYLPTKNLELGAMLSWKTEWPEKAISGKVNFVGQDTPSEAYQDPNDNTTIKSLTAYCDWHLDAKGKLLSLTYQNYKKDDNSKTGVSSDNYNGTSESYPIVKWKDFSCDVDYHIHSAKLDLTLPFDFFTIDAGASYTSIRNQADLGVQSSSTTSNTFYTGNVLDYQEKSKVAYISLHHDWGNFAMKAGLRYEHIDFEEEVNDYIMRYLISGDTAPYVIESKDYWLPSLSFSYKPKEGHQFNFSWGTNCQRPNFYDLNPIHVYKTEYEHNEGNLLLRPSRMSNIELSYHNHHGFYACAYHRHGSNMTFWQTDWMIYKDGNEYVTGNNAQNKPQNYGRTNQTGLYLRYQRQLSERLMATAEGDVFYHDAASTFSEESYLYGWGKRMAVSADWYLNTQHTLLLNARYQHWFSDYHDMTETDSYGYFYFALRYALLGDRLRLSLVANDPFHQFVANENIFSSRKTVYDPHSLPISGSMGHLCHINHHAHYIGLTATYSFGGKKLRHTQRDLQNPESKRAEKCP